MKKRVLVFLGVFGTSMAFQSFAVYSQVQEAPNLANHPISPSVPQESPKSSPSTPITKPLDSSATTHMPEHKDVVPEEKKPVKKNTVAQEVVSPLTVTSKQVPESAAIQDNGHKRMQVEKIGKLIKNFQSIGVQIRKEPEFYVDVIDSYLKEHPRYIDERLGLLLRRVAILEGDYDNGQDRAELLAALEKD